MNIMPGVMNPFKIGYIYPLLPVIQQEEEWGGLLIFSYFITLSVKLHVVTV